MESKAQKIQMLARKNRLAASTPSFFVALSKCTGIQIGPDDVIDPAAVDALRDIFRTGYKSVGDSKAISFRRFFRPAEQAVVFQFTTCLSEQLSDDVCLFITKLGSDDIAVRSNPKGLLAYAESVIALDGDSLSLLSADLKEGILVDHNIGDPEREYEIAVWGDRWPLAAMGCWPSPSIA